MDVMLLLNVPFKLSSVSGGLDRLPCFGVDACDPPWPEFGVPELGVLELGEVELPLLDCTPYWRASRMKLIISGPRPGTEAILLIFRFAGVSLSQVIGVPCGVTSSSRL